MLFLLFLVFEILTESNSILNSVRFSFSIWTNNLFPSMFPFFVLSEILISFGLIELLGELFKPLMNTLFCVKGECAFVFFMSLISGFPASAKYTRELYLKGIIDEKEASKVLTFSHFSNPLFILGTISITFLNNKEVGILILICHYFTNVLLGIFFRNLYPYKGEKEKVSFKKAICNMHEKRIQSKDSFGTTLTNAIVHSTNTLLLILGVVTVFLVLTTILDNNLNLNNYYQSILNGIFEMTQGLKYVSLLNIPLKLKATLSTMIISFGGLSVHVQIMSILSDTKISYFPFFVARIMHSTISSILVYFLFDFLFI